MNPERLENLVNRYLSNTASPEEEQELTSWYHAANEQQVQWPVNNEQEAAEVKGRLLYKIQQAMHPAATTRTIPFYKKGGWQAAAAILILLSAGAWFWFSKAASTTTILQTLPGSPVPSIVPGGNKAILTLADGSTIMLDSAHNTTLAQQGTTRIIKLSNGQLAYQDSTTISTGKALLYNTISTPRGGQYEIILPDGSHVWLNAASSLRFPTAFAGAERKVQLTGEAYFEVAKNPAQPFKVSFNSHQNQEAGWVEVVGTHFNINAYTDEASIKTTLLEGKVKVTEGSSTKNITNTAPVDNETKMLAPGQQAILTSTSAIAGNIKVKSVDTDEVIAWKNGLFNFNNADIKTVMRQVARWYDVEIEYEGTPSAEKFEGEIPRNSTLTEVFKILELSAVHFKTEGRKVIVMP